MLAKIQINNKNIAVDLSKPIDISIPLTNNDENPIAWYLDKPIIEPVKNGDWIGKVASGSSSTNFNNIFFNPHGHGTHTECLGHITRDFYGINDCLKQFFFLAELISIAPEVVGEDLVITKENISTALDETKEKNQTLSEFTKQNISTARDKTKNYKSLALGETKLEALIIRTLPNRTDKLSKKYSNTNPPYLSEQAAIFIRETGIKHLLIDLPSVDKEYDEGKLLAHKAFWNVKNVDDLNPDARMDCTITEMVFVDDKILDGNYLMNLQIVNFVNDASPSKPVLYEIS